MCALANPNPNTADRNPTTHPDSRTHFYRNGDQYAFAGTDFHQYAHADRDADAGALGDRDKLAFADQAAHTHADGFAALFVDQIARATRWPLD